MLYTPSEKGGTAKKKKKKGGGGGGGRGKASLKSDMLLR